jgi:hypothetical protein
VPVAIVLALVVGGAAAYCYFKLGASIQDFYFVKGIAVPRVEQILAAKKNKTMDDYWYSRYSLMNKVLVVFSFIKREFVCFWFLFVILC